MKTTIRLSATALTLCLILSSCARKYTYLHGENLSNQSHSAELDIDAKYTGMAFDHAVFEVNIKNNTSKDVTLVTRDIMLWLDDMTTDNKIRLFPKNKFEMRDFLYLNGRDLQRGNYRSGRRKGPYTQGQANFDEHEKIDYVQHTNPRFLGIIEGFDNSRKDYIKKYVFEREVISPGESASFDLFFRRRMRSGTAELEFITEDKPYVFPFKFNYMVVSYR